MQSRFGCQRAWRVHLKPLLQEVTALKASFQRYKPSVNASACLLLAEYLETLGSCPMRSTASRWPAEQAGVQDCADSGPYRGAHDADQEALTLLANQASFTTDALRCLLTRVLKVPAMALGECMQELHLAASVC